MGYLFNMKEKVLGGTWSLWFRCTSICLTPNLATVSDTISTGIWLFPLTAAFFFKKMFKSDFENYYGLIWINRRISHLKLHTNFSIVIHILCQNQSVINQSHAQPMHCKTTQLQHSRQTTTSCIMKCRVQYLIIVNLWLATSMCIQKTPHCHSEMELCIY